MADLSEQIQSHFQRSIKEGYEEIKFGAGPVQLTYLPSEGRGIIDVVADVEKNPYKLKEHFEKVREALPEGEWELNPDTPQKQRIYQRWFRNDPSIRPSGDLNMKGIGREGFVMTKKNVPWTVRNDIYTLKDDSFANRRALERHLTTRIKDGYKPKAIKYGKDGVPHRLSTTSIARVLDPNDTLDKVNIKQSKGAPNRPQDRIAQTDKVTYTGTVGKQMKQEFSQLQRITPGKLHGHHTRMLQMYRPFFEGLSKYDQEQLARFAVEAKYPLGDAKANIAILDEEFHDSIHAYMRNEGFQVSSKQGLTAKHGIPDLGTTYASRKRALGVFFTNVQEPIERKLSRLKWDQHAKHNPLTDAETAEHLEWLNDKERRLEEKQLVQGATRDKDGINRFSDVEDDVGPTLRKRRGNYDGYIGGDSISAKPKPKKGMIRAAGRRATGVVGTAWALGEAGLEAARGRPLHAAGRVAEAGLDLIPVTRPVSNVLSRTLDHL